MKPETQVNRSIFGIGNYLVYFLASALIVTITIMIIDVPDHHETAQAIRPRALMVFAIIIGFALMMTIINGLWRRFTIGRPVKRILTATQQLANGDFSVRIEPTHSTDNRDELDAIIVNFNLMAKELGSVEALQSDFIANVSHELKTPFAVIQNYATLLQDETLTEQQRQQYTNKIIHTTQGLGTLITNILKLNKLENQQIVPKLDQYLINEQLAQCLINAEPLWEAKHIDINTDMPDIKITSDQALLALAWNNLIANAIKFSDTGGQIDVTVKQNNQHIIVTIRDYGIGMDDKTSRHIFDKFFQADTVHATSGNGLGLALVHRIVELLGGTIQINTTLGQGSSFQVTLPQ